jgi:hypothetical protein
MILRIKEITTLPMPNTNSTDIDITIEASSSAVIANAEHIPSTCIVIGLLSAKGSVINLASFFESSPMLVSVF